MAVKWDQVFLGQQGQKLVLSDALAVQSQGLKDLIGYQGRKCNLKEMVDIVEIV